MTQREFFENVITANISDEMSEFAQSMIDKLDKKNESRRATKSKAQIANDKLKDEILASMESDTVYTAGSIATDFEISTQKASALLKQLAEADILKVIDKYKTDKGRVKGYKLIETAETAKAAETAENKETADTADTAESEENGE